MPKATAGENALPPMDSLHPAALFSLAGKTALVTGGGSGIGAMIAAAFVAAGARVYIASRKDTSPFAAQLTAAGPGRCIALTGDLGTAAGVEALARKLAALEPALHILVNNSGTNWGEAIETYPMDAWDKVYALNVRAVFHLTRELLPLLESASSRGGPSSVINISSIEGITVPSHDTWAYSSGKAAVRGKALIVCTPLSACADTQYLRSQVTHLTKVMAGRFEGRGAGGITVNAIQPGPFPSRMMRKAIELASEEGVASMTVMGRLGSAGDIGGTCVYLSSLAGSWTTGAVITLDGGTVVKAKL